MVLNDKIIKSFEIKAATIPANGTYPERKGWKIDGYYLNGSEQYTTESELRTALVGEELQPAKSGKSLVIVGSFEAIPPVTDRLAKVMVARSTVSLEIPNLNDIL